jgi:hypothetical protein
MAESVISVLLSGSRENPMFDIQGSSSYTFSGRNCGSWLIVWRCEPEVFHDVVEFAEQRGLEKS